jgi:hypothetical protein
MILVDCYKSRCALISRSPLSQIVSATHCHQLDDDCRVTKSNPIAFRAGKLGPLAHGRAAAFRVHPFPRWNSEPLFHGFGKGATS